MSELGLSTFFSLEKVETKEQAEELLKLVVKMLNEAVEFRDNFGTNSSQHSP